MFQLLSRSFRACDAGAADAFFFKSPRDDLYPRSGHLLRLMREWAGNKIGQFFVFGMCMVYGLQEIPECYGGVDGDGSRGSEIDGTSTEFKGRRFK